MTRVQFMQELRERLARLSPEEKDAALSYYEEYFDEAGSGREQEVIDGFGSPAGIASRILADHAVKAAQKSPYNPGKGLSAIWFVILAVFAAPLALPLVFGLFGIVIAILASLLGIGAAGIGIVIGGAALFVGGLFTLFATPATALVLFGSAFLLWGIGKIFFVIIGAAFSLLSQFISWLFDRSKGDNRVK